MALPQHQAEWFSLWRYVVGQRHGVGMAVGELVHSEVENDLRRKGYRGDELDSVMDTILETDEIFREYATKADENSRAARNQASVEGAKGLIMGRSQEMTKAQEGERESKAI